MAHAYGGAGPAGDQYRLESVDYQSGVVSPPADDSDGGGDDALSTDAPEYIALIAQIAVVMMFVQECRMRAQIARMSAPLTRTYVDRLIDEVGEELYRNQCTFTVALQRVGKLRLDKAGGASGRDGGGGGARPSRATRRSSVSSGDDTSDEDMTSAEDSSDEDAPRSKRRKGAPKKHHASPAKKQPRAKHGKAAPGGKKLCHLWAKFKVADGPKCRFGADCTYRHKFSDGEEKKRAKRKFNN